MSVEIALVCARAGYGPLEVLHGVDLEFPRGSIVALLGRNGAGKTTALRCLGGLVALRAGAVLRAGRDITTMTAQHRATSGIVFIPDGENVFATLTVAENLELFAPGGDVEPALATFPELTGLLTRRAGTLSGGEQQMLALSRAVLQPATVLLLDEVSRGLAASVVSRLYRTIDALATPERTIVIVEQYLDAALSRADVVYVLRGGEVVFAGEPDELDDVNLGAAIG